METTLLCSNPTLFPHVIRHVSITTMQRHLNSNCKTYSSSSQAMVIFKNNIINKKRSVVKCAAGGVRDIKESEFSEVVLKSELPVLVEFVANWCGPCRLISPAVQSLALEYKEKLTIVKIDHDLNPSLIEEFKVYGLPTLILFKDGKMVPGSRREGAITKVKLKAYVDSLLDSVSVS